MPYLKLYKTEIYSYNSPRIVFTLQSLFNYWKCSRNHTSNFLLISSDATKDVNFTILLLTRAVSQSKIIYE